MPIETPKLTQDAERGGSIGRSGGTADLDNTTLPSPTTAPAVVKFEGPWKVVPMGLAGGWLAIDDRSAPSTWRPTQEQAQALADEKNKSWRIGNAAPDMLAALKTAIGHIEHMAAFFGGKGTGYSFEGLGEDMPDIRAALSKAEPTR